MKLMKRSFPRLKQGPELIAARRDRLRRELTAICVHRRGRRVAGELGLLGIAGKFRLLGIAGVFGLLLRVAGVFGLLGIARVFGLLAVIARVLGRFRIAVD